MALSLRQILSRYRTNQQLLATDASVVRQNVLDSSAFSQTVKDRADGSEWYTVRPVGYRKTKMLHICYAKDLETGAVPLALGKLEARLSNRKSTKKSTPIRNKVLGACRAIIGPQILDYRTSFWAAHFKLVRAQVAAKEPISGYPRCEVSGKSLWSNKTHVDHVYPFVRMVNDWLAEISLDFGQINCVASRKLKRLSMGEDLDKSWADYHAKHAKLRLIEAKANMSKGAKV